MKHIYHISRHYRMLTVWSSNSRGRRCAVRTCKPDAGTTAGQRHALFAKVLKDEFEIELPAFDQAAGWFKTVRN